MNKTEISYLTHTWNPLAMRCTACSPACDHCWHLRMANRLASNPMMALKIRAAYRGETWPLLLQGRLDEPAKRKKPAIIGVQLMGDLFHEAVFHRDILAVFSAALKAPQHTYVFLTKRSERMLEITSRYCEYKKWSALPGNWIGMVTAENQEWADKRVPDLLRASWAVRGISAEPLLGAVDLWPWLPINSGHSDYSDNPPLPRWERERGRPDLEGLLSLVIAGGESGPGARPMKPDWARGLRDQCQAAGVAYHFKQHGEWQSVDQSDDIVKSGTPEHIFDDGTICFRVGNKRAGHLLDGVEWREMPEVKE